MKYFPKYSRADVDKDIPDYAFVAITNDEVFQSGMNGQVLILNDVVKNSVINKEWNGKYLDFEHEAQTNRDNFTKYGVIVDSFINDEGFIDNRGKERQPVNDGNHVMYAICELNDNGKNLLKKYGTEELSSSCFYSYDDDNGEAGANQSCPDGQVVVVKDIKPISLSLLKPQTEPRIKIEEPYVINSLEKQLDNNLNSLQQRNNCFMDNEGLKTLMDGINTTIKNVANFASNKQANECEDKKVDNSDCNNEETTEEIKKEEMKEEVKNEEVKEEEKKEDIKEEEKKVVNHDELLYNILSALEGLKDVALRIENKLTSAEPEIKKEEVVEEKVENAEGLTEQDKEEIKEEVKDEIKKEIKEEVKEEVKDIENKSVANSVKKSIVFKMFK